jgi:hypothetical protein
MAKAGCTTALVIMTTLSISSCTSGSHPSTAERVTSPPSPTQRITQPSDVVASATELGPGWRQRTVPGGDQVAGQITLDLCGGGYASEGARAARLQIALKRGRALISEEVVRYQPGGAQRAYAELKNRVAHCPDRPVAMPEAGAPRVRWVITPLPPENGWSADVVAVRATGTAQGKSHTGVLIYQFAGDWLAATYSANASRQSVLAAKRVATLEASKLRQAAQGVTV